MVNIKTADQRVLNEENESRLQHRSRRRGTAPLFLIESKVHQRKTTLRKIRRTCCEKFVSSKQELCMQIGFWLLCACQDSCWNHDTSIAYQSEANGIIENAVRRVEESTSALLVQSGLSEKWWREATDMLRLFAKHTTHTGRQNVIV